MAYKSGLEKAVAKAFKNKGIKFEYEAEVVHFIQPEKKRKYTPDFRVQTKDGTVLFVETKGRLTRQDRQKMIWVKEQNPKLHIVLLFQNSSIPIQKGSPTSYGDWADKNGFEFYDFRKGLPAQWT